MKRIEVEITGIAPLLQHRFPVEEHGENKSKSKKKVYMSRRKKLKRRFIGTPREKSISPLNISI